MKSMTLTHGVAVCLGAVFAAANANAQSKPKVKAHPAPPVAATASADAPEAPVASAAATAEPAATEPAGGGATDHSRVVGRFGATYFGISGVPVGAGMTTQTSVPAPVLGVRYWLQPNLGIDAGIGFGFQSSSTNNAGMSTSSGNAFGLLLHGGVPLVFASGQHYAFEIIPEGTIGFATGNLGGPSPTTGVNGFSIDLGARAGAEISFGFMGIPQLSMVASVGVYLHDQSWGSSPPGMSSSGGQSLYFKTSVQNDPWSIFADNISAIYYF